MTIGVGNQGHMSSDCDEEGCPTCLPAEPPRFDPQVEPATACPECRHDLKWHLTFELPGDGTEARPADSWTECRHLTCQCVT